MTVKLTVTVRLTVTVNFPGDSVGNNSPAKQETRRKCRFDPWVRKIPWKRKWQPILVFLPGESYGHRSLVGYSPWGCKSETRHRN